MMPAVPRYPGDPVELRLPNFNVVLVPLRVSQAPRLEPRSVNGLITDELNDMMVRVETQRVMGERDPKTSSITRWGL
jgi:hypothetical protein